MTRVFVEDCSSPHFFSPMGRSWHPGPARTRRDGHLHFHCPRGAVDPSTDRGSIPVLMPPSETFSWRRTAPDRACNQGTGEISIQPRRVPVRRGHGAPLHRPSPDGASPVGHCRVIA